MDMTIEMQALQTALLVSTKPGQLFYKVTPTEHLSGLCLRVKNRDGANVPNAYISLGGDKPFRLYPIKSDEMDIAVPIPEAPLLAKFSNEQPSSDGDYESGELILTDDGPFLAVQHDHFGAFTRFYVRMRDSTILEDLPRNLCRLREWKLVTLAGEKEIVWLSRQS